MLHFLVIDFDEDVVVLQLVLVASEQLLVKRQGTALFALDFEVSQFLAGVVELLGVLDTDHSGTEWSRQIPLDLRLRVKDNSGLLLKDVRNLVAGDIVLGEVI